jgi:hydroxyacylglutathione hydrolase
MTSMIAQTFAVGPLACNCTIVADESTGEAIVVDGGDGVEEVVGRLSTNGWRAKLLVHTHAHIDHIGDLGSLRERTGARGLLHPADLPLYQALGLQAKWIGLAAAPPVVALDGELRDGESLEVGAVRCRVMHTPGHTPGSVCFEIADGVARSLLTGDTLFAGSIGRWDLGGTSMEEIVHSIRTKLMTYDDDTPVVPGHGPFTTIGIERTSNPYLANPVL